ncbi:helix-turn-helix domain-containing protein [Shinella yambaruensis]|uniref:helix-turn-helix domain-containing protein n=1 Tax=Shinella yambaruensis TaxID=415996 RepID=UPI003D7C06D0
MSISAAQSRAARALLNWSQQRLCDAAGVGRATLTNFEAEKSVPYERTLRDVRAALEEAGIIFIEEGEVATGSGVLLRDQPSA